MTFEGPRELEFDGRLLYRLHKSDRVGLFPLPRWEFGDVRPKSSAKWELIHVGNTDRYTIKAGNAVLYRDRRHVLPRMVADPQFVMVGQWFGGFRQEYAEWQLRAVNDGRFEIWNLDRRLWVLPNSGEVLLFDPTFREQQPPAGARILHVDIRPYTERRPSLVKASLERLHELDKRFYRHEVYVGEIHREWKGSYLIRIQWDRRSSGLHDGVIAPETELFGGHIHEVFSFFPYSDRFDVTLGHERFSYVMRIEAEWMADGSGAPMIAGKIELSHERQHDIDPFGINREVFTPWTTFVAQRIESEIRMSR